MKIFALCWISYILKDFKLAPTIKTFGSVLIFYVIECYVRIL